MLSTGFFQALGLVLTVLLAAGTALGTWAALRTGRQSQIIKNYRDAANSWREKSEAQASEISQLREDLRENRRLADEYQAHSAARIAELETQVAVLTGIVTARDEFNYLNDQVKGLRTDTSQIISLLTKKD